MFKSAGKSDNRLRIERTKCFYNSYVHCYDDCSLNPNRINEISNQKSNLSVIMIEQILCFAHYIVTGVKQENLNNIAKKNE